MKILHWQRAVIDAGIKLANLYEANYPEYLHNVFVVNGNHL